MNETNYIDLRHVNDVSCDPEIEVPGSEVKVFVCVWQIHGKEKDSPLRTIKVSRDDEEEDVVVGEVNMDSLPAPLLSWKHTSYGHPNYGVDGVDSHLAFTLLQDVSASMKGDGSGTIVFSCVLDGKSIRLELPATK